MKATMVILKVSQKKCRSQKMSFQSKNEKEKVSLASYLERLVTVSLD